MYATIEKCEFLPFENYVIGQKNKVNKWAIYFNYENDKELFGRYPTKKLAQIEANKYGVKIVNRKG